MSDRRLQISGQVSQETSVVSNTLQYISLALAVIGFFMAFNSSQKITYLYNRVAPPKK